MPDRPMAPDRRPPRQAPRAAGLPRPRPLRRAPRRCPPPRPPPVPAPAAAPAPAASPPSVAAGASSTSAGGAASVCGSGARSGCRLLDQIERLGGQHRSGIVAGVRNRARAPRRPFGHGGFPGGCPAPRDWTACLIAPAYCARSRRPGGAVRPSFSYSPQAARASSVTGRAGASSSNGILAGSGEGCRADEAAGEIALARQQPQRRGVGRAGAEMAFPDGEAIPEAGLRELQDGMQAAGERGIDACARIRGEHDDAGMRLDPGLGGNW